MITSDAIIVSIDSSHGRDSTVLLVGRKRPNQSVEIINAFQGKEAIEIYDRLVTQNPSVLKAFDGIKNGGET